MEGLIPFVIHAIKKSRERSKYLYLSEGSSHASVGAEGGGIPWPEKEGSSHHRRTRSEFQLRHQGSDLIHHGGYYAPPPSDLQRRGLAPSRSLRDDARPSTAVSGGMRRTTGGFW